MNNGLTNEEVLYRKKQGLVNHETKIKTKSIKTIILNNSLTLFNILNLSLGLAIILVGSYKNLMFLGIVFLNSIIGITEEIKAKKTIDRLKILISNEALVLRDNKISKIHANEIVMDDIIKYEAGSQVLVDSIILNGKVLVNESLVTGEATPILKSIGDNLIAGSFIISGNSLSKVVSISDDTFTGKIYAKASNINSNNSIIIDTLNKFIKVISILIIPIGLILFHHQLKLDPSINDAVINTVAALVGMIPDGLILLSSTVFLVSALKLVKKNILVTDLNCIDSLAAIDVFCFDKTGTITNDNIIVKEIINLNNYDIEEILNIYSNNSSETNSTIIALRNYFKKNTNHKIINEVPFNSINKYAIITIDKMGTFIIGANESIENIDISKYENNRVLAIGLVKNPNMPINKKNVKTIGLVLLEDTLKDNAIDVITNLQKKDIKIKLISGDSKKYLETIASRINLNDIKCYDFSLSKEHSYDEIAINYNVFSRATPDDKLYLIKSLKNNHRVAMMGDGVNDTLALKEADASITFIKATSIARNVSKIILLDDNFDSINELIKEGRKTMNNLVRSATLFINKTIYSFLLALLFIFVNNCYPFSPIQLTLNNFVLIGAPSFILSLLPNQEKLKKNFIKEILKNSIPSALIIFINIVIVLIMNNNYNINEYISTMSFYLVTFNGFLLLYKVCYPFNKLTISLNISLLFIYLFSIAIFKDFFEIVNMPNYLYLFLIIMFLINICLFRIINLILVKRK